MKKAIRIVLVVFGVLLVACAVFFIGAIYNYNNPKEYFPTMGVWYCEELGIQLRFGEVNDNFINKGNQYIYCQSFFPRGPYTLFVDCQDVDSEYYELGEIVFMGEYVAGNDHFFSVRESNGSKEYTFVRRDDYISTPATQFFVVNANSFSVEEINTDINSTFSDVINNNEDEHIFNNADLFSERTVEYDLYCSTKNRTDPEIPYYDNEMYIYIVITCATKNDEDAETHIFGFCITPDGMQETFCEERHTSNENAMAFLENEAEYIGRYSLCIE